MKETTKQYLRLFVLVVIVITIIFYEPISSGRFFQASEKLEVPLSIVLDGTKYTFSKDLTVAEFEKNGWTIDYQNDKEGVYSNIDTKLIPPQDTMTLAYTKTEPYTYTGGDFKILKAGRIHLYIRNKSSVPLLYSQCECIGVKISDYFIDLSIYFPKGISFGDSYGRVRMAYGNGQRLKTYREYVNHSANPQLQDSNLLYKFVNSKFCVILSFHNGRLETVQLKEFEADDFDMSYPWGIMQK